MISSRGGEFSKRSPHPYTPPTEGNLRIVREVSPHPYAPPTEGNFPSGRPTPTPLPRRGI
ncbi:MAG: hypothetical protein LBP62_03040 [Clostridiales bacterium]|nr:hypothetical protein [Clostridiales bacterium]